MVRLNKYLRQCGLGSRRKVEDLILEGRVTINGLKVSDLAISVDPEHDTVSIDSKIIRPQDTHYYIILNKPAGYVTTLKDEKNRPTVMDLIPEKYRAAGVFPVGRLDKDTEGLLLLTSDGDLAHRLSRPENKIEKKYHVILDRPLDEKDKEKIEKGIFIHQLKIKTRPTRIEYIDKAHKQVFIILREGKKRQIRYTFKKFNYNVKRLIRISYGTIILDKEHKGDHRLLKSKEIKLLKSLIE